MAESMRDALRTVLTIGEEHSDGHGAGAKAISDAMGINRSELEAVIGELVVEKLDYPKSPITPHLCAMMDFGFIAGARWQKERDRDD